MFGNGIFELYSKTRCRRGERGMGGESYFTTIFADGTTLVEDELLFFAIFSVSFQIWIATSKTELDIYLQEKFCLRVAWQVAERRKSQF